MPSGVADDHFSSAVSTTGITSLPQPWLTPPVRPPELLEGQPLLNEFELLNVATKDPIGWFAQGSAVTHNVRGTPTMNQGQTLYITS